MPIHFRDIDIKYGKKLVANISKSQYDLGELADAVETRYGDGTLEEFAKVIGIAYNTLKGYRYVWRRWKNSEVKPKTFSLAKALASYEERESYIHVNPDATEEDARDWVKKEKKEAKEKKENEIINTSNKGKKTNEIEKLATKLISEMDKQFEGKWEHSLGVLSRHRDGITHPTTAKLIRTLTRYSKILDGCKDKFRATKMVIEHEDA
jgi:hypothetical protein